MAVGTFLGNLNWRCTQGATSRSVTASWWLRRISIASRRRIRRRWRIATPLSCGSRRTQPNLEYQLIVTGESADGGLTAATTLYARDKGEVSIAFQMPICPMIDDRNNSESARDNDAPLWNQRMNGLCWKLNLGDLWGMDDVPAYAAPARATDYRGLPPTYVYVGAIDPFASESIEYVENLKAAGVPADIDVYEGAYHGFDMVKKADVTRRAHGKLYSSFEHAVQKYTAPQPETTTDVVEES